MLAWRGFLTGRYHLTPKKSAPKQIVLVLSTYRTGSTLLIDYLSSIPGSRFYGELMHTGECRGPRSVNKADLIPFLRSIFHVSPEPRMGFKLHIDQLEASDASLEDLKEFCDDTRFLLLYRKCLFRQYVSHCHARRTNVWQQSATDIRRKTPLKVDPKELLLYCDSVRAQYERTIQRLRGERYLTLSYETLCNLGPMHFATIFSRWSGAPAFHPTSPLRKQADVDLGRDVANLHEVMEWVDHPRTKLNLEELERRTAPEFAQEWIGP
jgi:LPS sulfotransferase NodH